MLKNISSKQILFALGLVGILTLGVNYASAIGSWSNPTANPTGGNAEAPINVSNSPQVKGSGTTSANLGLLGNLSAIDVYATGKVGVGTTAPESKLEINSAGSVYSSGWQKTIKANDAPVLFENGSAALGLHSNDNIYLMTKGLGDYTAASWGPSVAMMVQGDGKVGIGTTNPTSKLTLAGSGAQYLLNVGGAGNGRILVRHIDGKEAQTANADHLYLQYDTGKNVGIGAGVPFNQLTIKGSAGSLGLGANGWDASFAPANAHIVDDTSSYYALMLVGNDSNPQDSYRKVQIYDDLFVYHNINAGGVISAASSRTLKNHIEPLSDSEYQDLGKKLENLDVVHYFYNNDKAASPEQHIGFIAEDAPAELVTADGKGVNVNDSIGFLLGVVKEQQKQIKDLNARLTVLEAKVK